MDFETYKKELASKLERTSSLFLDSVNLVEKQIPTNIATMWLEYVFLSFKELDSIVKCAGSFAEKYKQLIQNGQTELYAQHMANSSIKRKKKHDLDNVNTKKMRQLPKPSLRVLKDWLMQHLVVIQYLFYSYSL
jgi:hypothetical protein